MKKKNVIWIASYPKSGNTWLRIFIGNLLSKDNDPININNLPNTLLASNRALFDEVLGVNSSDLSPEELDNTRPSVYEMIANETNELVFFKVHDAWNINSMGRNIFPYDITKGVIYLIRNPLDVVISLANHNSISINESINLLNNSNYGLCNKTTRIYSQLFQSLGSWSGHVSSWLYKSKLPLLVIRYEDMLEAPFDTFSSIIRFLGFSHDEQAISRAIEFSSFNEIQKQETSLGFSEKPIGQKQFFKFGRSGIWKEILNDSQSSSIVENHFSIMQEFGYI